ncbi:MAG: 5-bromo-4-chloroindolyl phosphate hydrolysis family protein [Eubacteriales bacterium]|nr:5-bromo-4-chloroindolyl phosphate hydrolysis family protein [Eubacteriales bacterium]
MDYKDYNNLADLEKLGDKVQDIIETAVNSRNYQKLNQTITQAVNKTVRQYQETQNQSGRQASAMRTSQRQQPVRPIQRQELPTNLYGQLTGERVKRILMTVFGGVLTGSMGIGLLVVLILQAFVGGIGIVPLCFMLAGTAIGVGLLSQGCSGLGRLGRFKKYIKALGTHTYCNFEQLARVAGKPVKFVKKDIKGMIRKGWFLEGHIDKQETCLITANETYRQYEETQKQLEIKKEKEAEKEVSRTRISPEVQEVLDKGDEYLEKIRRSNDAIQGEEISAKISKMEQIVQQIFIRAEEHPEIIPDLKRLMNYYLPMTVKLLDAYEDMDRQPIQGENIRNSKKEIEDTLDTLNDAFARLLDSVFQNTAWDVSSDISVLHTVLAQEGLTGNDFPDMK